MNRRTDQEVEKAAIMKAARAAIVLKHRLAADRELNDKLPDVEEQIDDAIMRGETYELPIASLLGEDL